MAINRSTLEERIETLRADLDAWIDARVEIERGLCPGVPATVLRGLIVARGGDCQCSQYLQIKKDNPE